MTLEQCIQENLELASKALDGNAPLALRYLDRIINYPDVQNGAEVPNKVWIARLLVYKEGEIQNMEKAEDAASTGDPFRLVYTNLAGMFRTLAEFVSQVFHRNFSAAEAILSNAPNNLPKSDYVTLQHMLAYFQKRDLQLGYQP